MDIGFWDDVSPDALYGFICQYKVDVGNNDTWRLVKVDSETATTTYDMLEAIKLGITVPGQTEVLYRPDIKGWHEDSTYSWTVRYDR